MSLNTPKWWQHQSSQAQIWQTKARTEGGGGGAVLSTPTGDAATRVITISSQRRAPAGYDQAESALFGRGAVEEDAQLTHPAKGLVLTPPTGVEPRDIRREVEEALLRLVLDPHAISGQGATRKRDRLRHHRVPTVGAAAGEVL